MTKALTWQQGDTKPEFSIVAGLNAGGILCSKKKRTRVDSGNLPFFV